jgi:hypothetical protein
MNNKDMFDVLDDDIPMLDDIAEPTTLSQPSSHSDHDATDIDNLIDDDSAFLNLTNTDEIEVSPPPQSTQTASQISEETLIALITPIVEEKMQQFASEMSRVIIKDVVKIIKEQS